MRFSYMFAFGPPLLLLPYILLLPPPPRPVVAAMAAEIDSSQELAATAGGDSSPARPEATALVPFGGRRRPPPPISGSGGRARASSANMSNSPPPMMNLVGEEEEEEQLQCWLCQDSITDLVHDNADYRGFPVHRNCSSALRCHARLMRAAPASKAEAAKLQTADPSAWKRKVLMLLPGESGYRDPEVTRNYHVSFDRFTETSTKSSMMLLTKQRHKQYHKQWDGWGSDTCSENVYELLDNQSNSEAESDDQPRVWDKDVERIERRTGNRVSATERGHDHAQQPPSGPTGSRRSDRYRGGGDRRAQHSNASRRSRSRNRVAGSGGRRSRGRSETPPHSRRSNQSGTLEAAFNRSSKSSSTLRREPRMSPQSDRSGTQSARGLVSGDRRRRRANSPSEGSASKVDSTGKRVSQRISGKKKDPSTTGADEATSFLARRKQVKKGLEETIRKERLKTAPYASLKVAIGKLSEAQLKSLQKTGNGDYHQLLTSFENSLKEHDSLLTELVDVDADGLAGWEAKLEHAGKTLADLHKRVGLGPYNYKGHQGC